MTISTIITVIYIAAPILIAAAYQRSQFVRRVGTVIIAYAVGLVLAVTGMVKMGDVQALESAQNIIMDISVPIAIPLMLFNCNFRLWTHSLPKTVLALVGGLLSITVAVVVTFFLFRNSGIGGLDRISGLMMGIYTGGTLNFFALGSALRVDESVILLVYAFEMLVTFPLIMFIMAGGYRLFRRLLPFPDESITLNSDVNTDGDAEDYSHFFARSTFGRTMIGLLLAVLFLAVAAGISLLITGVLSELIIILVITTLAIAASFSEKVRNLPKTFELGMVFILMFSVVVASKFDVSCLNSSALTLMCFVLTIMCITVALHLILCRIFHISGDLFTVANIGMLCSPPFIPPVVGAMGNRKVLISGIIIGLVGYAVGTYMGIGMAYLLKTLM